MRKFKIVPLLATILCALLLFASCTGPFDFMDFEEEKAPSYTQSTQLTSLTGSIVKSSGDLVYLYDAKSDGSKAYTVYNIETNKTVFQLSVAADTVNDVAVQLFALGNKYAFAVSTTDTDSKVNSVKLYDAAGKVIASASVETDVYACYGEVVVFGKSVYGYDDEKMEKLFDITEFNYMPRDCDAVSDDYFYEIDNDGVKVYDKEGNFKSGYVSPSYAENFSAFVLESGNVAIQYLRGLPYDAKEYDIFMDGEKYTVVLMIMDAADGDLDEIDFEGILFYSISSRHGGLSEDFDYNVAYVCYADEDGYLDEDRFDIAIVNNKLSVKEKVSDYVYLGDSDIKVISDKIVVCEDIYGNTVFLKKSGKLIKSISADCSYTDEYIVTDSAIYDFDFDVVYDLEKNGYTFVACNSKIIILTKETSDGYVEYARFVNGAKTPETLFVTSNVSLEYAGLKLDMYCLKNTDAGGTVSYKYYDATGKVIFSFSEKIGTVYRSESGYGLIKIGDAYYRLTFKE